MKLFTQQFKCHILEPSTKQKTMTNDLKTTPELAKYNNHIQQIGTTLSYTNQ
jgi:hypothetical protein